ncbi:unnamed protein product [Trichobilharzia regenti]|nr:unnamed protein product [Trichobilharzia regenti]
MKKQRDFVAEHLRDSLGVIRQLFHSLNMSSTASTDLFKPLFIDTETSMSSDQSTGGGCCPQSLSSESNPCEKFKTCMQMSPMMMVTSPSPSGPTDSFSAGGRSQLQQQQQEALTALFTNPLVSALLNTQTDISGIDASKMKSETQVSQLVSWLVSVVNCCPDFAPLYLLILVYFHFFCRVLTSFRRSTGQLFHPSFWNSVGSLINICVKLWLCGSK